LRSSATAHRGFLNIPHNSRGIRISFIAFQARKEINYAATFVFLRSKRFVDTFRLQLASTLRDICAHLRIKDIRLHPSLITSNSQLLSVSISMPEAVSLSASFSRPTLRALSNGIKLHLLALARNEFCRRGVVRCRNYCVALAKTVWIPAPHPRDAAELQHETRENSARLRCPHFMLVLGKMGTA
jgi:hypothetical protein